MGSVKQGAVGQIGPAQPLPRRQKMLSPRCLFLPILLGAGLGVSGCTAGSKVSTSFYEISGNSAKDLEREILAKGPDGGKALALTALQLMPVAIEVDTQGGACRFRKAKFRVAARITLPRWREQAYNPDVDLRDGWTNLADYARAHEQAHVKIAEKFAKLAEKAFLSIPRQRDCGELARIARRMTERLAAIHDKVQHKFDDIEKKRLGRLVAQAKKRRRHS